MSKLIEVEIENKSYIKLLNIEQEQSNMLKLTTLKDNQSAVIIKVFINMPDERILIKEFNVRNLKPKVSGLPRFELGSSYNNKILNLELKVDGKKVETATIKLSRYLGNNLLPLFILFGLIALFLLFVGGRWLFSELQFTDTAKTVIPQKTENVKTEIVPEKQLPVPLENKEDSSEGKEISAEVVKEVQTVLHIAYFTPNNTAIQKDAANILKDLARELISKPNALVEISGYCAMTGTEEGRERLSRERAYNVLGFLKKEGWKPETAPEIKWYGGRNPVTYNQDEIYRNRRVEIEIVSQ